MTEKRNEQKQKHTLRNVLLIVGIANLIPAGIIFAGVTKSNEEVDEPVLSLSDSTGAPGSLVEVNLEMQNNETGWINAGLIVTYDENLDVEIDAACADEPMYEPGMASLGMTCQKALDTEKSQLALAYASSRVNTYDGVVGTLYFQIPEDAQPGDEFDIQLDADKVSTRYVGEKLCTPIDVVLEGCTVTVVEDAKPEKIEIGGCGQNHKFEIDTDLTIEWSSSDERIAEVDQEGNITTGIPGTAVITAKYGEYERTFEVTVTGEFDDYRGNLDGNDKIDTNDAVLILKDSAVQMLSGQSGFRPAHRVMADVNEDGEINSSDAAAVLKYNARNIVGSATWSEVLNKAN